MSHWKVLPATMVGQQEKVLNSRRSRMSKAVNFWPRWQTFNSFSFETFSLFNPASPALQTATISKTMIKFWSKLHIQILRYSFTRNNFFLLTPSQSLPGKHENLSSSVSRHISNSLSMYLFLDSELSNGGKKVQVKKVIKKQTGSAWNFLQPPIQVCRSAYIPYLKGQRLHFVLLYVFL